MDGIDPDVLLEWLQTGMGEERDLQLMALEQLCMLLLMSDNIDRCFESCPPRTFLPALCNIFLDETATDNVLEVTARAITYYLDVSNECTRRITQVDGAVKAICNRLAAAEMTDRTSKDLAEQCVKLLEHVCQRETLAVYDAGGMHAMLTLVRQHGHQVHKDTMHSAMTVVTRLCGKMEPDDSSLPNCAESLGALLVHDDVKISESALRCFAALTDRFIRKMMDPAELTKHSNLVEHLLLTLASDAGHSANFISIVVSLLSNLCRGSAAVTEQVFNSPTLMSAIQSILTNKDDRCVTDGLRLADLFVMLLCEGRSSLPPTGMVSGDVAQMGAGGERSHRHLIDAIRQKDHTALVEAVENGSVDVNFADDVGQTLCNWASAFGSLEMVQYLCEKGADVNKGSKSSSLHYAACFGRPDIVKLLLQRGANPDLRDEDGKTALEKARERSDEDHNAVAQILESPSVYSKSDEAGKPKNTNITRKTSVCDLPAPELINRVLKQMLPIFCEIYQKSLSANVRRTTLSLLRKIVEHMQSENLHDVSRTGSDALSEDAERLLAVVVAVLEQDDAYDSHEQVLLILSSLLKRDPEIWVSELIRLGIFERIGSMIKEPSADEKEGVELDKGDEMTDNAGPVLRSTSQFSGTTSASPLDIEDRAASSSTAASGVEEREKERISMLNTLGIEEDSELTASETPPPTLEVADNVPISTAASLVSALTNAMLPSKDREDKKKQLQSLQTGVPYRWKEWRLSRGEESLFIWCDVMALELSFASNGHFRYLMDGEVSVVFSNGREEKPEKAADAKKNFLSRWRRSKAMWNDDHILVNTLSIPSSSKKVEVPQWEIMSARSCELTLKCTKSDSLILVKDESGSFVLESAGKKFSHSPETTLPTEFHTGWCASGITPRRAKFRLEIQRRKVQELAWELWNAHLKDARAKPRMALLKLQKACAAIVDATEHAKGMFCSTSQAKSKHVKQQPRIEKVQELVAALNVVRDSVMDERRLSTFEFSVSGLVPALLGLLSFVERHPSSYPGRIFKETFGQGTVLSCLALKIVQVLEATERFPQYLYDSPGGSAFGLQLLTRRIRLKLLCSEPEDESKRQLLNRTGKTLKSEPLTSVGQLKNFLLKMVAKQWYDRDRNTFNFIRLVQEKKSSSDSLKFTYTSDFDDQGIVYWIGTNGKSTDWSNPASIGIVNITTSDSSLPFGKAEDILSRDANPVNCHTSDDKHANFTIDLGLLVYPSAYTLRHARGYARSALRNWFLQGSKDRQTWELLVAHSDDTSLNDPGSSATWPIEDDDRAKGPYRYFRIAQNGKNSSGQTHYLSLSGFEIYGEVVDAVLENLAPKKDENEKGKKPSASNRKDGVGPSEEKTPSSAFGSTSKNNRITVANEEASPLAMRSRQRFHNVRSAELRGRRVTRGKDWRWDDQDGGPKGVGVVVGGTRGWVDVQWENGTINSYRYGDDGKFDVQPVEDSHLSTPATSHSVVDAIRARSRGIIGKSRENSHFSAFTPLSSFTHASKGRKTGATTTTSRFNKQGTSANASAAVSSSSGSSIGKKSMSTTNLVDDRSGKAGPSVASTGQAASAESLSHQTPSLENLLERANPHKFGKIAETAEAVEAPEGCETPQPIEADSANTSVAGSQAELSVSSSHPSEIEGTVCDTSSTPQSDSKSNNLSVSAPDLAAARTRQQSSDVFEMYRVDEDEDQDHHGEDDDEPDTEDDDASDKVFAEMMAEAFSGSSVFEKLREVFSDDPAELLGGSDRLSAEERRALSILKSEPRASTGSETASSTRSEPKKDKTLKQRLGGYAEVLKGLVQTVMDPSASSLEVDELLDDDEYFDDDDGNEDEGEDDLSSLELPVESLASVLGAVRGSGSGSQIKLNWRQMCQLTQLMGSGLDSRYREYRLADSGSMKGLRAWEDEVVLKCSFQALIPAFDPRPGRTNVNQTQEVELPTTVPDPSDDSSKKADEHSVRLFLRGPNMPGVENVTIEMGNEDHSLFRYVQDVINLIDWGTKGERGRRVWEPTYTLIYEDASLPSQISTQSVQSDLAAIPTTVNDSLHLIGLLSRLVEKLPDAQISNQVFISDKLTLKLTQELSDALVVAARALPEWCELLVYSYPCLFSMETRNMYLNATAYGVSRSIIWLQQRRDQAIDRIRGGAQSAPSSSNRVDRYEEFRIGRLKHERVKVNRCEDQLLEEAVRLMKFHAERKAVLEIEYHNEEGTGLGPTLEFFALVAAELQRKALAIWLCDDGDDQHLKAEEQELDLGEGKKPPGFYVRRAGGLFPAPLPPHSEESKRAAEIFRTMGIFLAKILQDNRLVDLPLSRPFLKMVVSPELSSKQQTSLDGVLSLDDLEEVHPVKGVFLKELRAFAQRKRAIQNDAALDRDAKRRKIDELTLCIQGQRCRVEDLALNFTVNPPSSVFEYGEMELVQGGSDMDVTSDNVELYVQKCADFYLNSGILEQMRAFREGFDRVFPLKSLRSYSADELLCLVCGEQFPEWTRDDVLNYTEPKLGYTKESAGFLLFVDVMVGLNAQERKNFLQFATGCSSLPPGGLANLHPRLTVVRKVESGDGSYPSVNTCVHYLKLPEYSSAEILRERLLTAVNEKGFHLN